MSLQQKLKRRLQDWLGISELQRRVIGEQPIPRPLIVRHHGAGRVVAGGKKAEYTPDIKVNGGRVVRAMPHELKQIKEGQERVL